MHSCTYDNGTFSTSSYYSVYVLSYSLCSLITFIVVYAKLPRSTNQIPDPIGSCRVQSANRVWLVSDWFPGVGITAGSDSKIPNTTFLIS
jgi:hypothetical protein